MHGIPLARRQIEQFVDLYEGGESSRSIAKKFNRCHSLILLHLDKLGIKRRERIEAAKLGVVKGRIKIFKHKIPGSAKCMSLEKAYVLGVLCGDGCISCNKSMRRFQIILSVTNKEFFNEFRKCLHKVYRIKSTNEYRISKVKNWQNQYVTRLCSKAACEDLLVYGRFRTGSWRIPAVINSSSLEIQARFLRGLYDSDGNVEKNGRRVGLTSISVDGLCDVKDLLNKFNIRSVIIRQRDSKPNRKNRYVLRIQDRGSLNWFSQFINFTIFYKRKRLDIGIRSYKLWTIPYKESIKLDPLIIKLRQEGLTYEQIGEKLNVGAVTAWNHLQKLNNIILVKQTKT